MKTGKPPLTRAVIYVRQSKTHDGSISQELQEASCRRFAEQNGYKVVATEADIDFSGLDMEKRKGLARAMKLFEDKKADALIVWRWSRLSRKRYDQAYLMQKIEDAGGRVESAEEPMDPTAAGRFTRGMLMEMAAFESEQKSETWKQVYKRRLEKGLPASGTKYFGYIKFHDRYEIHEEMAQHLRKAYEMFNRGVGSHHIARMLNDAGARDEVWQTEDGESWYRVREEWTTQTVLMTLRYDFYRGKIKYAGKEEDGKHTPLIDEAKWQAFKKADTRARAIPAGEKTAKYWLSGLVRCGHCGGSMIKATSGSGKHTGKYLRCRTKAFGSSCPGVRCRQDHIEWAVWVWLLDHLDDLANQLPSDDDAKRAADEAVATTRAAMDVAEGRLSDLLSRAVRYGLSDDEVEGPLAELRAERAQAIAAHEDALARQGSFVPAADVMERWKRGMELRDQLAMVQPVYDPEGNEVESRPVQYRPGMIGVPRRDPNSKPVHDKDGKVVRYVSQADPEFQEMVTAEFNADLRKIIKSITVSPDFPDKPGPGEKPIRFERYKIKAA